MSKMSLTRKNICKFLIAWLYFAPCVQGQQIRATRRSLSNLSESISASPEQIDVVEPSPTKSPISMPVQDKSSTETPSQTSTKAPTITKALSDGPSVKPSPGPSIAHSDIPSRLPTTSPTLSSEMPSELPSESVVPSLQPSVSPTLSPSESNAPSLSPSSIPTASPSEYHSSSPSNVPSQHPTQIPTSSALPTSSPTSFPSRRPSPSPSPTLRPTLSLSSSPSGTISTKPSPSPTRTPTLAPSSKPSNDPTSSPTESPISWPTESPATSPSSMPSDDPSSLPSLEPTSSPSLKPSNSPTSSPSLNPTNSPTSPPSQSPSAFPSDQPTPSPSASPSETPTLSPSDSPSSVLSEMPTNDPSENPSLTPSDSPSQIPSLMPSVNASKKPSSSPSSLPTLSPSSTPTSNPTPQPSSSPSLDPTASPTEKRPNLIMILTDEHNYRTLSSYRDYLASKVGSYSTDVWGDVRLDTPNIDMLAKEGALYSNFYTVAPLCTPSRASFMTGMYPAFTGNSALNHGEMDQDMTTFAKILKDKKAYRTGYFGKWHLDGEHTPGWGHNGRMFGFEQNKYRFNRGHFKWIDKVDGNMVGYEIEDEWRFAGRQSEHFTTDYLIDRGIDFMKTSVNRNDPFAMVISIPDPHGPNDNRRYYRDMYKDLQFKVPKTAKAAMNYNPAAPGWNYFDLDEIPLAEADDYLQELEDSKNWQTSMQQYYGMVKCIDHNIGKLMSAIKDLDIDEDTIIVFTSDHGDLLMEHGKNNKGRPYDTAAGIPFLIRYPAKVPAGKVVETAYSSVDFAPTILSLMGVTDTGIDFQGVDGTEELLNSDMVSLDEEKVIISMDSGKTPTWAMAQLGWNKLVISKGDNPWLFDLILDPNEMYNYMNSYLHADIQEKLQNAITEALFKYKIPLSWYANNIYIDTPSCTDKKDILPLSYGPLARCTDIGTTVNSQKCEAQSKIRNHCPVTCKSCCQDTDGIMIVEEEVFTSCAELKSRGKCMWAKVESFCPVTCGKC
uniref:ShKT domain-containing protein n=1 Tax=Chaetoceros debilis TaxID=122233 RepID=A0A7S3Q400_9STRA